MLKLALESHCKGLERDTQQLRVHTTLEEDPSLFPSTNGGQLMTHQSSSRGLCVPSSGLHRH